MESPTGLQTVGPSSTTTKCPSLPAEVWRLIFSVGIFNVRRGCFNSTFDYPTMASICRSCTLFRDLVRPRLYYSFDSHVFTEEWHFFSVAKFAWSICTSPRLASMVQRVKIQKVCDMSLEPHVASTDSDDHPMATVLTRKAAELGMEFKYYEAYTDTHGGNVGFDLVALVLAQLPMLEELNLDWFDTHTTARMPEPRGGWPWTQTLRTMQLKPCRNASLVDVRYPPSPDACYSLSRIQPLLCSGGRLETISFFGCTGPNLALPLENLREVVLIHCQFSLPELRHLLHKCKRIRKFVYLAEQPSEDTSPAGGAAAREIIEALEPSHGSLEVLGIDFRIWPGPWGKIIASLERWTALKTLYLSMECFWDWEAGSDKDSPPHPDMLLTTLLPESIEEVALFGTEWDAEALQFKIEPHLKGLARDRKEKGRFQQLKQVSAQGFWPLEPELPEGYVVNDGLLDRVSTLYDAKALLKEDGVEVNFDVQDDSELEFGDIIWFH